MLGALAWGILLVVLGRSLHARRVSEPKLENPLEMSIVEIPDLAAASPAATLRSPKKVAESPISSTSKQAPVKPALNHTLPVRTPTPASPSQPMTHAPEPEPRAPAQSATAGPSPSPPDHVATAGERASTGSTPGDSPARAITQPLPSVPDDLREQAYQAVAVARFVIHTDGSVAVELIKPTQYPRLNQILVETLRGWRFFPAIQDGHPVETQQDVRVHFNVS